MKMLKLIACGLICLGASAAQAAVLTKIEYRSAALGFSIPMYVWKGDSYWTKAFHYEAETNHGDWHDYPAGRIRLFDESGEIGPVMPLNWYRSRFYHRFLPVYTTTAPVFVAADICGMITPKNEN